MVVILSVVLATMLASSQAGLPMNCRSVVYPKANTPLACVMITRTELGSPSLDLDIGKWGTVSQLSTDSDPADSGYNDLLMNWVKQPSSSTGFPTGSTGTKNPSIADSMTALNPNLLPGACRWDLERSNMLGSEEACLCPATELTCTLQRKGCYWYEMPDSIGAPTFACINTAERFYHLLSKLLKKRGKKDFAIKIRYGATPARGLLPLGPYGPAVIGGGSHSKMQLALQQLQKRKQMQMGAMGGYGGMGPYGGMGASPFAHGPQQGMSHPIPQMPQYPGPHQSAPEPSFPSYGGYPQAPQQPQYPYKK